MNEYQLRQFAKAAELSNISKAAVELNLTQQALSHAISTLEKELGCTLFARKARGLELTTVGQRIYPVVQSLLSKYDEYQRIIYQIVEEDRRTLSVCFDHIFTSFIIPSDFYTLVGGFRLHMEYASGFDECLEMLRSGKVDIALTHRHEDVEGFLATPVLCEPPVIVMSESDLLAQKNSLTIEDLRYAPFVMPKVKSPVLDKFIDACINHGFYPKTVFESADMAMLKRAVVQNRGVLLSASFGLSPEDSGLVYRPLIEDGLLMELGFLQYEDAKANRYVASFIAAVQAIYE